MAPGGICTAGVFQPCRSGTTGQCPVNRRHREIYLGILAFLQRSQAKNKVVGGVAGSALYF